MKRQLWFLISLALVMPVCNLQSFEQPQTQADEGWNLAYHAPVNASGYDQGFTPQMAVDGLYSPFGPPQCWVRSGPEPNWIEVKIPLNARLYGIEVLLDRQATGLRFEAWARLANDKLESLGKFDGKPDGNGLVRVDLSKPRSGITGVRLEMLDPGFPCIHELGMIGSTEEPPQGITPGCLGSPDVIYHHGMVITMNPDLPTAEAVAIKGDRIWAVGTDAEIQALNEGRTSLTGSECTVEIDLSGRTVVPGFIDSHQHRINGLGNAGYNDPEQVIQLAIEQGWTSVHEMYVDEPTLETLRALDHAGKLRLRFDAYLALTGRQGEILDDWYQNFQPGTEYSPYLRLAGVKIFIDHGWGHGPLLISSRVLNQIIKKANDLGWQVAVHTVGEAAHTAVLDAYEASQGGVADDRYRNRIEHVIVISDEDIARMERLGVIAAIQLNGPSDWLAIDDFRPPDFTPDLIPHFARWRDLFAGDVKVIGSSDWHSAIPLIRDEFGSPMLLLYQAVTRTATDGGEPKSWMLDQTITIEQAFQSLTINGAYASFEEHKKGSLEYPKLADLVILASNPLTAPIESVPDIQVLLTMIGGKVEYCADGNANLCPGPFTGTWMGIDPDDDSETTVVLEQYGDRLTGTFSDTYSPGVPPPGYEGSGTGTVHSYATGEITFDLTRPDGNAVTVDFSLTLSNREETLTLNCVAGCTQLVLQRQ